MKQISAVLFSCLFLFSCFSQNKQNELDSTLQYKTIVLESKILNEKRTINCWFPADVNTSIDSIPVLYMLDGGVEEDFLHLAKTIQELIHTKMIPPMMLVGIENTVRRRDLTGKTNNKKDRKIAPVVGGSDLFRRFVAEELFTEISSQFPFVSTKKGIIGESLAGLFVTETLLLQPNLFDYYIAFDPSLWWNDHQLVKNAANHLTNNSFDSKRYWFASSNASDIFKHTNSLATAISSQNAVRLVWKYESRPTETHATIFKATKVEALLWMFGPNK